MVGFASFFAEKELTQFKQSYPTLYQRTLMIQQILFQSTWYEHIYSMLQTKQLIRDSFYRYRLICFFYEYFIQSDLSNLNLIKAEMNNLNNPKLSVLYYLHFNDIDLVNLAD